MHQRLDRGDRLTLRLDGQHGAGIHSLVVEQHGASAALAAIANPFRPRDVELVSKGVKQRHARLDLKVVRLPVYSQGNGNLPWTVHLYVFPGRLYYAGAGNQWDCDGDASDFQELTARNSGACIL